jgi:hypothetical protein
MTSEDGPTRIASDVPLTITRARRSVAVRSMGISPDGGENSPRPCSISPEILLDSAIAARARELLSAGPR